MADYRVVTSDFVNLHVTTSKNDVSFNEKRFPKDITIKDLKGKLELITGGGCDTMQVDVYTKENQFVCTLLSNEALLGSYPLDDGMRLHVTDKFIMQDELDLNNIEKFELSKEEYSKKSNTVKAFLEKNKLGQYDEEYNKKKQEQEEQNKKLAESIILDSRCKVQIPNAPTRFGTVMYSGKLEGLQGYWVGVKYDEPLGKNDGTHNGKRYFECPPKYGAFVKPQYILCGDYPEEEYDINEEI